MHGGEIFVRKVGTLFFSCTTRASLHGAMWAYSTIFANSFADKYPLGDAQDGGYKIYIVSLHRFCLHRWKAITAATYRYAPPTRLELELEALAPPFRLQFVVLNSKPSPATVIRRTNLFQEHDLFFSYSCFFFSIKLALPHIVGLTGNFFVRQ
jgi:hypothetical protein